MKSRDFGSRGKLRAFLIANGQQVAVRDSAGLDSVTIPLDDNGDGIADGWADQQGGPFRPEDDNEPGGIEARLNGDGITAVDEYRGFYYLDPATGRAAHVRTNPVTHRDIFFWPQTNLLNQAVMDILGNVNRNPDLRLWRVSPSQAQAVDPRNMLRGVRRLNPNGTGPDVYALIYANVNGNRVRLFCDDGMPTAFRVQPGLFLGDVKRPIGVEVAAEVDGPKADDGFGHFFGPAHT